MSSRIIQAIAQLNATTCHEKPTGRIAMDPITVFVNYAAAFEVAFETDNWSGVESSFTEDVVYETLGGPPFGGLREGRRTVVDHLKRSLEGFDRRFDVREPPELLAGPELRDDAVWIRWRVIYRVAGAPPLAIEGEETAELEGDRIRRLEDRIDESVSAKVLEWADLHGAKLKQSD